MTAVLWACGLLAASGMAALAAHRDPRRATWIGAGGALLAGALGLWGALGALGRLHPEARRVAWSLPWGEWHVALDALSAVFLLPLFFLTALAALYGVAYTRPQWGRRSMGWSWCCYNLLTVGMALVLIARDGLVFLLAWECMALASFFLVVTDAERPDVRRAGWIYLVATHVGTAFLIVFFAVAAREAGSLDFDYFDRLRFVSPALAGALFLCALIGFGTKAGFVPLHVWLPEAHPAAPSHVSAVMSGVMIKTGVYGLMRVLTFFGLPPAWWGWLLIGVGLASGCVGVLYALAQSDMKRVLAYSSVENMGLIAVGLGIGVLGWHGLRADLACLGYAAALWHALNHAAMKGVLFLGAGVVAHGAGTRDLERLGGLMRRMPWTGAAFLVGAVAIAGLPPLNGFVGEFLLYFAAFVAGVAPGALNGWPFVAVVGGLALIGGLVAACFARVVGVAFLGTPRSPGAAAAREGAGLMRAPVCVLALTCVGLGLSAPFCLTALMPALGIVAQMPPPAIFSGLVTPLPLLARCVQAGVLAVGVGGGVALLRWRRLQRSETRTAVTWDCGYARPTPRMQYTASSFAQWFIEGFRWLLPTRRDRALPETLFPRAAHLETETPDGFQSLVFAPLFARTRRLLSKVRWIQHGRLQLYVLYIALALLALLLWHVGMT